MLSDKERVPATALTFSTCAAPVMRMRVYALRHIDACLLLMIDYLPSPFYFDARLPSLMP